MDYSWMLVTIAASIKYLWVVITHDWTSIEVFCLFFICWKGLDFFWENWIQLNAGAFFTTSLLFCIWRGCIFSDYCTGPWLAISEGRYTKNFTECILFWIKLFSFKLFKWQNFAKNLSLNLWDFLWYRRKAILCNKKTTLTNLVTLSL